MLQHLQRLQMSERRKRKDFKSRRNKKPRKSKKRTNPTIQERKNLPLTSSSSSPQSNHGSNDDDVAASASVDDGNVKPKAKEEKIDSEVLNLKKTIPNMTIILDPESNKPLMLFNKKTGAVSQIEKSENKDIIKTTSVPTKPLYSIPLDVTKHLEIDENNDDDESPNKHVRHKSFDSIPDLKQFLIKEFPKNKTKTKLSLFWSSA